MRLPLLYAFAAAALLTVTAGSIYRKAHSASNTLYAGDRAGSRYYHVLENTAVTGAAQAWSGSLRPLGTSVLVARRQRAARHP